MSQHYGASWSPVLTSAADVETTIRALPNGSRAIVLGVPDGSTVGHFFNVANRGGVARFFDGQSAITPETRHYGRFFILRTN